MYDETPCNDIPESLEYRIYRTEKNQNKVKSKGTNKQKRIETWRTLFSNLIYMNVFSANIKMIQI